MKNIMLEDLKKKIKRRDRALSILSKNGSFRAVIVRNTQTVITAQKNHNLSYIPAFFLAKTLTSAAMISVFLKGEERIIIDFCGDADAVLEKVYAEVLHLGECRGFVKIADKEKKIDSLSEVFGAGILRVSRILYNQAEPIVGIVPMQKGDIASDLAYYFSQSEQIDSAIILDTKMDDNGLLICSGGLMVQAMPGANENEINNVINSINTFGNSICTELEQNDSLEAILQKILPFEFDIMKNKQLDFYCRCNIENFKNKLLLLDIKELKGMKEDGHNELICQFCNKHYYLTDTDFDDLINQIIARSN
jgi:molecular chaperone Hsp33